MTEHLLALSTHAYYAGELDAGRRSCERLLSMGIEEGLAWQVRANRTFYCQTIDDLADVTFRRFDCEPAHDGWSLFNPTILHHGGQLLAIVRSSNYRIVDGQYVMPDEDRGVIRTENILCRLSPALFVESAKVIETAAYPKTNYPVDGLEDVRLRHTESGVGVSATVRNVAPFDGRCRIATADLDLEHARLVNLRVLSSLQLQEHEKNWMPLEGCGGWLYSCQHNGHTVTVDPDKASPGAYILVQRAAAPPIAREFRGGGQVVSFGGGWLAIIHEVAHVHGRRAYEHRFVWLDERAEIKRVSPPFCFKEKQAIEFAAGLAAFDGRVVVTFGVRDAEAWIAELPGEDVQRMLRDIG